MHQCSRWASRVLRYYRPARAALRFNVIGAIELRQERGLRTDFSSTLQIKWILWPRLLAACPGRADFRLAF